MSAVADWLARRCWFWMLHFMRRPWMKRLQHRWLRPVEGEPYLRFPEGFIKQNRFARKFGLKLLRLSINMFLASVFITLAYYAALYMLKNEYSSPPPQATRHVGL